MKVFMRRLTLRYKRLPQQRVCSLEINGSRNMLLSYMTTHEQLAPKRPPLDLLKLLGAGLLVACGFVGVAALERKYNVSLPAVLLIVFLALLLNKAVRTGSARTTSREHVSEAEPCPSDSRAPDSEHTAQGINKSLQKSWLWLFGGLLGIWVAAALYPPLDMNPVMGFALVLGVVPIVTHIELSVHKKLASHGTLVRKLYDRVGIGLILFAVLLFLNGALDTHSSAQAHARVVQKTASRGARGPATYSLVVAPSWRPGRNDETLEVSSSTFSGVRTGESVRVVVHQGLFRLPWFSGVVPD
jgi:hypothetical protein